MTSLPTLDGGVMWVGDAWVEWTHRGVRYWRAAGAIYAQGRDGVRCVLVSTGGPRQWMRQPGAAA